MSLDSAKIDVGRFGRREFLQGAVASTALTASSAVFADRNEVRKRALPLITIFLDGGADNKSLFLPDSQSAPKEYRGPFGSIQTNVPGMHFSELLDKTSRHADMMSIIKSINTKSTSHDKSATNVLHGSQQSAIANVWGKQMAGPGQVPYAYIESPAGEGYPKSHSITQSLRFDWQDETGLLSQLLDEGYIDEPLGHGDLDGYHMSALSSVSEEQKSVLGRRMALRSLMNRGKFEGRSVDQFEKNHQLGSALYMGRSNLAAAMNPRAYNGNNAVQDEYEKRLDAYGGDNPTAQSLLLAARLVEQGVPSVTVNHSHFDDGQMFWDNHRDLEKDVRSMTKPLDVALSGLLREVREQRFGPALVAIATEFDRTPMMNSKGGRDHSSTGTMVLAATPGHAIEGGSTYGVKTHDGEITEGEIDATSEILTNTLIHALADGKHDEFLVPNERRIHEIMKYK